MNPPARAQAEKTNTSGFPGLGIDQPILKILERLKFIEPTPIQHKTIPVALDGKDVIGIAQTGTGKTLAFGIPMIQRLIRNKGRGLILLPTRELAVQVDQALKEIAHSFGLRTAVLIGGAPIRRQMQELRRGVHVVIATPGRTIDHLQQKTLSLHDVKILVLDEADRMLDMGFAPQIKQILHAIPKDRQTMLFSATMPDDIVSIATHHMKLPIRVEIARPGTTAERVNQEIFIIEKSRKINLLEALLRQYPVTTLVFSRTKHGAKKICSTLRHAGHSSAEIHSNRSLNQRQEALEGFKNGRYKVLVATDIAARGIDVKDIGLVINYDIPEQAEDYVHRIGRTGRAGTEGHAITFVCPDQQKKVRDIERLIRTVLKFSKLPQLPEIKMEYSHEGDRPSGGSSQRNPYSRPSFPRSRNRRSSGGSSGGGGGKWRHR